MKSDGVFSPIVRCAFAYVRINYTAEYVCENYERINLFSNSHGSFRIKIIKDCAFFSLSLENLCGNLYFIALKIFGRKKKCAQKWHYIN